MTTVHVDSVLAEVLRIVKPKGSLYIQEAVVNEENGSSLRTDTKLLSLLKLTGFVDVSQVIVLLVFLVMVCDALLKVKIKHRKKINNILLRCDTSPCRITVLTEKLNNKVSRQTLGFPTVAKIIMKPANQM